MSRINFRYDRRISTCGYVGTRRRQSYFLAETAPNVVQFAYNELLCT